MDSVSLQRSYYTDTASQYDAMHGEDAAHNFALPFLASTIANLGAVSVLDIGAGTGRTWLGLRKNNPNVSIVGVEPVSNLREIGYSKGIPRSDLIDGNANSLAFGNGSFDIVCAFGVMHHLEDPDRVAAEMIRVARRAIFISDHNDYGRGRTVIKRLIRLAGLWDAYKFAITRGKGYRVTDDDGIWYPYSIFDTYKTISPYCSRVHFLNTRSSSPNLHGASHIAMLGVKSAKDDTARR